MEIDLIKHLLNSGFTQEINSEFPLTYTRAYDNIQIVVQLQKDKHMGIMLDPDTLTGGTFEEFMQFLRGKCPDAKLCE